jgi:hypothetical protein
MGFDDAGAESIAFPPAADEGDAESIAGEP